MLRPLCGSPATTNLAKRGIPGIDRIFPKMPISVRVRGIPVVVIALDGQLAILIAVDRADLPGIVVGVVDRNIEKVTASPPTTPC